MLRLTSSTMAKLRIQRLLSRKLICYFPTMTTRIVERLEGIPIVILVMVDLIRRLFLPFFHAVLVCLGFLRWAVDFVLSHCCGEVTDGRSRGRSR